MSCVCVCLSLLRMGKQTENQTPQPISDSLRCLDARVNCNNNKRNGQTRKDQHQNE